MHKRNIYTIFSILVTIYSTTAFSGNSKVFPGTICQPIESNYAATHLIQSILGEMYNNSIQKQYWICPLAKNLKAAGTRLYVNVNVKAVANNVNDMVKCSLNSRKGKDFPYLSSSTKAYQYDSSPIYDWQIGFDHLVDKESSSSVYVRCLVPGKRQVNGQWVRAGITSIEYEKYD